VTDTSVASITNVSVAGNPTTTRTTDVDDGVRIAATGMNTPDTGTVTVGTVTLAGESPGTSSLDLTVAAVGNESGSAYNVRGTTNGELTVAGVTTPTPTEDGNDGSSDTTDGDSGDSDSGDSNDGGSDTTDGDSGGSDGGDSNDDDGPDTTPAPTATPSPTPTTTVTETPAPPETTDDITTQSPEATRTETATMTGTTGTEPGSLQLIPMAVIGGVVVLVAGLIYYQRE